MTTAAKPLVGIGVRRRQRLLAERDLAEVPLVDLQHQLDFAGRREHEQRLARLHDGAAFDVARDQHAVARRGDRRIAEARVRGVEIGARLIELGLRHHVVAAAGACGIDLKFAPFAPGCARRRGSSARRRARRAWR